MFFVPRSRVLELSLYHDDSGLTVVYSVITNMSKIELINQLICCLSGAWNVTGEKVGGKSLHIVGFPISIHEESTSYRVLRSGNIFVPPHFDYIIFCGFRGGRPPGRMSFPGDGGGEDPRKGGSGVPPSSTSTPPPPHPLRPLKP